MKRLLLILWLTCIPLSHALCQRVTNVRAMQKGDKIVVSYDLSGKADVSVSLKIDGEKKKMTRFVGDVGKNIEKGQDKTIVWDVLAENPDGFNEDNVVFTVCANPVWRTFLLAEGAISPSPLQGSGGFMVGRAARWGYYLKFRSSFMFTAKNGEFSESRVYLNGYTSSMTASELQTLLTSNQRKTELITCIGALYNVSTNVDFPAYIYLGGGFGMRRQMWQTSNNNWLAYSPTSYIGFSGDLGIIASIKGFLIDVGVNTINFQYAEIQFGFGWLFNK